MSDDSADVGMAGLRRLTAAMNGREMNSDEADESAVTMPYSLDFVFALLDYSFGDLDEAAALDAMQVEDPSVLCGFSRRLARRAKDIGMDEGSLRRLQASLHYKSERAGG
jgi:hypothetical protein